MLKWIVKIVKQLSNTYVYVCILRKVVDHVNITDEHIALFIKVHHYYSGFNSDAN